MSRFEILSLQVSTSFIVSPLLTSYGFVWFESSMSWSPYTRPPTKRRISGIVSEKPGFFSIPNESEITGTNSKPAFLRAFLSRKM